jgi:hypothetical protein
MIWFNAALSAQPKLDHALIFCDSGRDRRWTPFVPSQSRQNGSNPMTEGLITPDQLRRITEETEMEKARAALEKKRKADGEHDQLRDAFMAREIHPEVFERVSRAVKSAAERGEQELMVLRFSSEYCTDGRPGDQQLRARLAKDPDRLRQARLRVLAKGTRAAWLQAARPGHGFSRRHAGRRGDVSEVVTRRAARFRMRCDIGPMPFA